MAKPVLNYNTFLNELDSREDLKQFNILDYTIEDKDAQNLTYEFISFGTLNYLFKLLTNDNWASKREDYKKYVLNRASATSSKLNRSQYLAILAKCFKLHVEDAFVSLKDVLLEYLQQEKHYLTTKTLFDNLVQVAFLNKKNVDQLYLFLSELINKSNISDTNIRHLLCWLNSTNGFKFRLTKINGIFEVCLSLVAETKEVQQRKHIIELSLQILDRLSDDDKKKYATNRKELYELLADNEYSFLLSDDPDNAAVPHYNQMFLRNILQWYKLAGNKTKAAKAEKELLEVKSKLIFPSFPVTIYTPEQVKVLNHKLEFANNCPPALFLLGLSDNFFRTIPSDSLLIKVAEDIKGPDGFAFTHLDYNFNSRNISEEEEPNYKKFLIYDLYVKPLRENFLRVFLQRIKDNTLNYNDIYEFLNANTNFGKTFQSYRNVSICYYDLDEKGLKHLYYQLKKVAHGIQPDFTLSIDSLSPKIERLLREILHSINASVLKVDIKSTSSHKESVILLDQILNEDALKRNIGEDNINYFKYVLTNDGMNIRNLSAHGLYDSNFYSSVSGLLVGFMLFVSILRLAVITNAFV